LFGFGFVFDIDGSNYVKIKYQTRNAAKGEEKCSPIMKILGSSLLVILTTIIENADCSQLPSYV